LTLIVLAAFVIGNTITTIFDRALGALGGGVGSVVAMQPVKRAYDYAVAPWRDHMWRTVAKAHLGTKAPNDTSLLSQQVFDQSCEMIKLLPVDEQETRLSEITLQRAETAMDDMKWEGWYDHYHQIVIKPDERDFAFHVRSGLNFNMEATSLYVLISALFVPGLRHWWCILPACLWIFVAFTEIYSTWHSYMNKWGSLSAQIKYLSEGGA
jgi:hypothetical protein